MKRARAHRPAGCPYVTRGGLKLEFALRRFDVAAGGLTVGDFGCHKGGFTDCFLKHGAVRVHSVDTAFGLLDWRLRTDQRVVVHERTNLLYWTSPEPLDLIAVDAGWTRQCLSVPAALRSLKPRALMLSLVKPQYEAGRDERSHGVLREDLLGTVMKRVRDGLQGIGEIVDEAVSPIRGTGGNIEIWLKLSAPAK